MGGAAVRAEGIAEPRAPEDAAAAVQLSVASLPLGAGRLGAFPMHLLEARILLVAEELAPLPAGTTQHAAVGEAGRAVITLLTGMAPRTARRIPQPARDAAAPPVAEEPLLASPRHGDEVGVTGLPLAAEPHGDAAANDRAGAHRGAADEAWEAVNIFLALGLQALEAARLPVGDTPFSRWTVAIGLAGATLEAVPLTRAAQPRSGKPVCPGFQMRGWQAHSRTWGGFAGG